MRNLHYDTVNFDVRVLQLVIDSADSDYLLRIGSLDKMSTGINQLKSRLQQRVQQSISVSG